MMPSLQHGVREGHPEVTFARLAGKLLAHSKKTQLGREKRARLLERHGIVLDMNAERRRLGRGFVSPDDMVDAGAMLVTAQRLRSGDAAVLGDDSVDARGLLMQIWA
jgi:predicted RNase H-like nuclease